MSLSIGIVGLPNSGKSTLFNALTKKSVPAENFPFCTIDPSVGIVPVPDNRLEILSKLSNSKKTIPSVIEFTDIAGLVKGAHKGEGLGNEFLAHIRQCNSIIQVVRVFKNKNIIHVDGDINPKRDIETINLELILADLDILNKKLNTIEKAVKKNDKQAIEEKSVLEKAKKDLENEKKLFHGDYSEDEHKIFKLNGFLTSKPVMYVLNKESVGENIDTNNSEYKELIEYIEKEGSRYIELDALTESELDDSQNSKEIRQEFNLSEDGLSILIKEGMNLLNLIVFFTSGEEETRSWQIVKGSTAPEAGTAIHTDFRDKFIRAEVIPFDTLKNSGSYKEAREEGKVQTVGRDYIVNDGDVMLFKI